MIDQQALDEKFRILKPHVDERRLRLIAAAEVAQHGHGGVRAVAQAAGLSRRTVERAIHELRVQPEALASGRLRRPGGGRKPLVADSPNLIAALDMLVDPVTRGDPMSPLRWTSKSTEKLAMELKSQGFAVSARSVAKLLCDAGYSLQSVRKKLEGSSHEHRDEQFQFINASVASFQAQGQPVVSIDAKKKELIGSYANKGREWQPKGEPVPVNTYDFKDEKLGKVTPYGVFDIAANEGWVSVGIDHDTAEFAGETIKRWWQEMGNARYPKAEQLLITVDGGGSNGVRLRLWKRVLQQLATAIGLEVHVRHFPPGTSKWNKIEHRMFSQITHNWRGRPLVSRQVVVDLIGSTSTKTGLRIRAALDEHSYPTKQCVSDEELAAIKIHKEDFHGEWNYHISPC
jgi:hypothetical protein